MGSREIIVAVIDAGFDLRHPDLIPNWYLNAKEIPASLQITDKDGDGIITFIDLNQKGNVEKCKTWLNSNSPFNICDPLDLIDDSEWSDGKDTDGNGYVDDLVGYDFSGEEDNNPHAGGVLDVDFNHGTYVAGIIGAVGDNRSGGTNVLKVDPNLDPQKVGLFPVSGGIAGMSWRVRILPLRVQARVAPNDYDPDDADDIDLKQAILYAKSQGAHIVNISLGTFSFKDKAPPHGDGHPECGGLIFDGLGKNFEKVRDKAIRFYNYGVGNMLVTTSAGNCSVDVPNTAVITIPKQPLKTNHPNQVIVVAATDNATPQKLTVFSARGVGYADIAAPGFDWTTLNFGGGTITVDGTSFASPTVAGSAALILARKPNLVGDGPSLQTAVFNAASGGVLTSVTGGRFLNLSFVP